MNVNLDESFEHFVTELVRTGQSASETDVIRKGLRLLKEQQGQQALRVEQLRAQVQLGLDEAKRGEVAPFDLGAIKSRGREILAESQPSKGPH